VNDGAGSDACWLARHATANLQGLANDQRLPRSTTMNAVNYFDPIICRVGGDDDENGKPWR